MDPKYQWVEIAPGRQRRVLVGGEPKPDRRSDLPFPNVKVFGERTYEHMPRAKDDPIKEGPMTFTSETAFRAHCRKVGVKSADLL